jgi:hypothetical protein
MAADFQVTPLPHDDNERADGIPFAGSGDQYSHEGDLPTRFRRHADAIERAGRSPLSAALMRGAADDIESGGHLAELIDGVPLPSGQAPALRVLAALHRLVLADRAPELAPYYPSVGGERSPAGAWDAADQTLRANAEEAKLALRRGVQTNEPGRSAVLFGVLLQVAERYHKPVRLFEIGASAGLNLLAPRYAYRVTEGTLGDVASPLVFEDPWISSPVQDPVGTAAGLAVTDRRGCDVAPIDPTSPDGQLTLLSYIWPDEPDRIARMRAALAVAQRDRPVVDEEAADSWLERVLSRQHDGVSGVGVATVVWQSVVAQYLEPAMRAHIDELVAQAGIEATYEAPLVYARMEPGIHSVRGFGVVATNWPGDESVVVAVAGDHGPPVRWCA